MVNLVNISFLFLKTIIQKNEVKETRVKSEGQIKNVNTQNRIKSDSKIMSTLKNDFGICEIINIYNIIKRITCA